MGDKNIDHLIRQTLEQDLPADVENELRSQIRQFHEQHIQDQRRLNGPGLLEFLIFHAKPVLTTLVFLLLLAGSFLLAVRAPNALADSISGLQTEVLVSSQIQGSESMQCEIRQVVNGEILLQYSILWNAADSTSVRVESPDKTISETLTISEAGNLLINHTSESRQRLETSEIYDHKLYRVVMGFISPEAIVEQIHGQWKMGKKEVKMESSVRSFLVITAAEDTGLDVSVDRSTYLPTLIKKVSAEHTDDGRETIIVLEASFHWDVLKISQGDNEIRGRMLNEGP
jgi:hypothetical protein